MEPHPDQEDRPEPETGGRGGIVAAVVIGAIVVVFVVLHLVGAMALHAS
jgi:hypothetical protein